MTPEETATAVESGFDEDIVIIGAGPGGIAAAVQLKRSGRDPLVFERGIPGGLVRNAWNVENYPGFAEGIPGRQLADLIAKGLPTWEIRVRERTVERLELDTAGDGFIITAGGEKLTARAVIVATGTVPMPFDIPGLSSVPPGKVHREVHHLVEEEGKSIAIIGGGDAAFDYALSLGERNLSFILNRSFHAKALGLLEREAESAESVRRLDSTRVTEVVVRGESVFVKTEGACTMEFAVDHIVVAVGREPATSFIDDHVLSARPELEAKGLFYMVGDVARGPYRQVAIAAGDGLLAAMAVNRTL